MTAIAAARLEALVIARLETAGTKPPGPAALVKALRRFAPRDLTDAQWRQTIDGVLDALRAAGTIDARWRAQEGELARRIGRHAARTWPQLADRVLPALGLGIDADDAKSQTRLDGRDGWAAAIVGRRLGVWKAGPPLSPSAAMNAVVWQALELPGPPKLCPAEIRGHFLGKHLGGDSGPPERLLRVLAAQTVDAPRAELRALRDGLVRMWLAGRELGEHAGKPAPTTRGATAGTTTVAAPPPRSPADPPRSPADPPRSLVADVRAVADAAREGVFGERKVFISAVWNALRAMPAWAKLELDELKARLVEAHRRRELVLARADLVAAMDPALVAASETQTDGATFHFVVREPTT